MEEAGQRIRSAVERKDGKAEDGAIEDYQVAEIGALWRDFPDERLFLADLYERDKRWRAKSSLPDKRRRPTHSEDGSIAKALLADISKKAKFDAEGEAETVAKVLAGQYHDRDPFYTCWGVA